MLFPDYNETKRIYHIVSIIDLERVIKEGIRYNDKKTYKSKYYYFHDFLDAHRTEKIPPWVVRKKAIFGSLNFEKDHKFHSHTALLGIKVDPDKCWIANEDLANHIYEPFILKDVVGFEECKKYLKDCGAKILKEYWDTSLSFNENLKYRLDKDKFYDAEVLILHDIKPQDIEIISIISDHNFLSVKEWKEHFCRPC